MFLTRFYYRDSFSRWICAAFFYRCSSFFGIFALFFLYFLSLRVSVTPVLVALRRCFYRTSESSFAAIIPNLFYYSFLPFSGNQLQLLFLLIGEQLSFFLTYQLCPLLLLLFFFFLLLFHFFCRRYDWNFSVPVYLYRFLNLSRFTLSFPRNIRRSLC